MTKRNDLTQGGMICVSIVCLSLLLASCQMLPSAQPKPLSSYDDQVQALLARMSLEEKIGQMIQLDQEHLKDPRDIETYFIGSVLSGGSSDVASLAITESSRYLARPLMISSVSPWLKNS